MEILKRVPSPVKWGVLISMVLGLFLVYFLSGPTDSNISRLSAWSGLVYTVLTCGLFFAAVGTFQVAAYELRETRNSRDAEFLLELCRWYASREMHEALRFVHSTPPEKFDVNNFEHQHHRRLVSDFWNMAGAMVEAGTISPQTIKARFPYHLGSPAGTAKKLKPLEKKVMLDIMERNGDPPTPELRDAEAERKVNQQPFVWLANNWGQLVGKQPQQ